jgi:hypothetical protein
MVRPVSRGVIGTARAAQTRLKPMGSMDVATNSYITLTAPIPDLYQLKDRRTFMRMLVRGDSDIHGRRLMNEAARADARYIIKLINQRLRGLALTVRQTNMLLASLRRVYAALETGSQ